MLTFKTQPAESIYCVYIYTIKHSLILEFSENRYSDVSLQLLNVNNIVFACVRLSLYRIYVVSVLLNRTPVLLTNLDLERTLHEIHKKIPVLFQYQYPIKRYI